jgi:hypothetical protein
MYCWKDRKCAKKWEKRRGHRAEEERETPLEKELKTRFVEEQIRKEPEEIIFEETIQEPAREEEIRQRESRPADARMMRKLQAARRTRYEQKIADWQQLSGEEKPAENVRAFLLDLLPSMRRLEDLLKEILKKGGKRGARAGRRQELAGIVISIYLDRLSMEANEEGRWEHLRTTLQKSGIRIADRVQFYLEWRADEMRQLAPDLDEEKIQTLIRMAAQD